MDRMLSRYLWYGRRRGGTVALSVGRTRRRQSRGAWGQCQSAVLCAILLGREDGLQDDFPRLRWTVGYERHALAKRGLVATVGYLVLSPARKVVDTQRGHVLLTIRKPKTDVIALTGKKYYASSHHFILMRGSCAKGTTAVAMRQTVSQRATDSIGAGCKLPRERRLGWT